MTFLQNADFGILLLRLAIGGEMLLHGIHKIGNGVGGIQHLFAEKGLPEALAYGAYLGEVIAPLLIIVGWYSRLGGLLVALTMIIATATAHFGDIFTLTSKGGWGVELQALFLFGALAIAFLGSGKYAISGGRGAWD